MLLGEADGLTFWVLEETKVALRRESTSTWYVLNPFFFIVSEGIFMQHGQYYALIRISLRTVVSWTNLECTVFIVSEGMQHGQY